jgi:hypothetical protein
LFQSTRHILLNMSFVCLTKNTVVLEIEAYLVSERRPFTNHFVLVYTSRNVKARLSWITHVLYQLRAYTTIYAIHVHSLFKTWLKTRYWLFLNTPRKFLSGRKWKRFTTSNDQEG